MSAFEVVLTLILFGFLGYEIYDRHRLRRDLSMGPVPTMPTTSDEPETIEQAIPFDPDNPPVTKRYKGSGGVKCSCHGRALEYGEEILWWPTPDGGVHVICKQATP